MATVKFYLNRPKDKKGLRKDPVAIIAKFSIDRTRRFEIATGERIVPTGWNFSTQKPKATYPGHQDINLALTRVEVELLQLWRENKSADLATLKEKAKNLIKYGAEAVQKKSNDFEHFIQKLISDCETGKLQRSRNTIQTYKATLEHLQNFCKDHPYKLTFDEINLDFFHDFCQYCWDELGHTDNTLGKSRKILISFMNEAFKRELHANQRYRLFPKFNAETDDVYLTEDEILAIYNHDLTAHPHLIPSRDLFVFGCWVGLRYSDLTRIKPQHVHGNTITITTKKTSETVVIPFHPIAKAIYERGLPDPKANANFNYDIKDICELVGLKEVVQKRMVKRGETKIEWLPKFKMVTAHTARRSFATNCYKMGVPTRSIMAITGHKTEKAFNRYIKLSKEEHSKIMAEIFNKPIMKVAI